MPAAGFVQNHSYRGREVGEARGERPAIVARSGVAVPGSFFSGSRILDEPAYSDNGLVPSGPESRFWELLGRVVDSYLCSLSAAPV
jgi:hypothetical protein